MAGNRKKAAYAAAAAAAATDGPIGFAQRVGSIPRMVRDVLSGRFDGIGRGRLVIMALAVVYIISPIDLIPEAFLTLPGMLDDAGIAAWLIAALFGATTAYRHWETGQASTPTVDDPRVVPGEVLHP
jgi:uncharacterized membrane protein YkvA (DUF1232 family)